MHFVHHLYGFLAGKKSSALCAALVWLVILGEVLCTLCITCMAFNSRRRSFALCALLVWLCSQLDEDVQGVGISMSGEIFPGESNPLHYAVKLIFARLGQQKNSFCHTALSFLSTLRHSCRSMTKQSRTLDLFAPNERPAYSSNLHILRETSGNILRSLSHVLSARILP